MDHASMLAKVLGIVFLVGGVNALFNRKAMAAAIEDVNRSAAVLWIWGFINLLFGAAIVALYNVWIPGWRVIIPICGWASLVKGTWIILLPDSAKAVYRACNKPGILAFGGVAAIVLGLILLCVPRFR